MAQITNPSLSNKTIYSVYIRNHSKSGDFEGLIADLERISKLGVDIIWLLPIHPIGVEKRKGTLGSPYSIRDYRSINPEIGTMDDFSNFIEAAHKRNLAVIIDIVFNHTSVDSLMRRMHPDWFWKNPNGIPGNEVGEWNDVIKLDYSKKELWNYQIETLKKWIMHGVDGFRCDVASMLPLSFWFDARDACSKINPDTIWIAETVESSFINTVRRMKFNCLSDCEIMEVFDLSYDYDVYPDWVRLIHGEIDLIHYIDRLRNQESILRESDLKLRFLENHDCSRVARLLASEPPDECRMPANSPWSLCAAPTEPHAKQGALAAWSAFSLFQKGTALIYAGQEYMSGNTPSLFNRDPVDWSVGDNENRIRHRNLLKQFIELKKLGIVRDGYFWYPPAPPGYIVAAYERRDPNTKLVGLRIGVFNVENKSPCKFDMGANWDELRLGAVFHNPLDNSKTTLSGGILAIDGLIAVMDWGLID